MNTQDQAFDTIFDEYDANFEASSSFGSTAKSQLKNALKNFGQVEVVHSITPSKPQFFSTMTVTLLTRRRVSYYYEDFMFLTSRPFYVINVNVRPAPSNAVTRDEPR